jgi:hypothetical protein
MLVMADVVIALFFLRYRRRTHERLFTMFAAAFFLLAVQRLLLGIEGTWNENTPWWYGMRLVAFLLIIAGIVEKNRRG